MEGKNYKWFYIIGIIVLLIGIIISIIFLKDGLKSIETSLKRVVAPTDTYIYFDEAGDYTIYYEYRSVVDDKLYSTDQSISGLYCQLKSPSGKEIDLQSVTANSHYNYSSYEGSSVLEFTIDEPGKYEFSAWYYKETGPEIVLAIGKGFFKKIIRIIIKFIAIALISLIMAAILIIMGYKKKKKFDKEGYILVS